MWYTYVMSHKNSVVLLDAKNKENIFSTINNKICRLQEAYAYMYTLMLKNIKISWIRPNPPFCEQISKICFNIFLKGYVMKNVLWSKYYHYRNINVRRLLINYNIIIIILHWLPPIMYLYSNLISFYQLHAYLFGEKFS